MLCDIGKLHASIEAAKRIALLISEHLVTTKFFAFFCFHLNNLP